MKKIGILGSTGSIGTQTLSVIDQNIEKFKIEYLTANSNIELLCKQSNKYKPNTIGIGQESMRGYCKKHLSYDVNIVSGREGLLEIAKIDNINIMVNALVGYIGMETACL